MFYNPNFRLITGAAQWEKHLGQDLQNTHFTNQTQPRQSVLKTTELPLHTLLLLRLDVPDTNKSSF